MVIPAGAQHTLKMISPGKGSFFTFSSLAVFMNSDPEILPPVTDEAGLVDVKTARLRQNGKVCLETHLLHAFLNFGKRVCPLRRPCTWFLSQCIHRPLTILPNFPFASALLRLESAFFRQPASDSWHAPNTAPPGGASSGSTP